MMSYDMSVTLMNELALFGREHYDYAYMYNL